MNKKNKHSKRGYLLLEVMVAGAITAAACLALLTMLADSRLQSVHTARDITARGLASRGLERARQKGFLGATAIAPAPVTGLQGTYIIETRVTAGTENLFLTQVTNFKDVEVVVTHPLGNGVSTERAAVRLYE